MTGFTPFTWTWTGEATNLVITNTGLTTVSLWMREDGLRLDRLLLTTDTPFIPTAFAPAESERTALGAPPITTRLTRTIVYTYDHLYRLTHADYSTGQNYQYDYDEVGNRLQQITVLEDSNPVSSVTTDYLIRPIDGVEGVYFVAPETITTIVDSDPAVVVEYDYDLLGNISLITEKGNSQAGQDDRFTHFEYVSVSNAGNRVTNRVDLITRQNANQQTIAETDYAYPAEAAPSEMTVTQKTLDDPETAFNEALNSQQIVTYASFDAYGNIDTTYTGDATRAIAIAYDNHHTFPQTLTYPDDSTEERRYDPGFGIPTVITDRNGLVSRYTPDQFGRIDDEIGPNGGIGYTYVENSDGLTVFGQYEDGSTVTQSYNGLGQLVTLIEPGGSNETGNTLYRTTSYGYDGLGRQTTTTLPAPDGGTRTLTTHYDTLGRPKTVELLDGTTNYTYNGWQTVEVTDALNQTKRYTMTAFGRVTQLEEGTTSSTKYNYNTLGHLRQIEDTAGNLTKIRVDSLGRKLQMNDPDMGTWHYTYNIYGEMETQTDARGVVTTLNYDNLGRLRSRFYNSTAAPEVENTSGVSYVYDDAALTVTMADGSGHTTWSYDQAGRLLTETKTITGYEQEFTTGYSYTPQGQLYTMTYPDGETVTYTYNQAGQIKQATGHSTYLEGAAYTPLGQVESLRLHGGDIQQAFTYHPLSFRPATAKANNGSLQDLSFTFDALGRPLTFDDARHGINQAYDSYDLLNRLTQVNGSYAQSYGYDDIGNLRVKNTPDLNLSLTFPTSGPDVERPHAPTGTTDGSLSFGYDTNGNLNSKSTGVSYTYDAENRLTQVISGANTTTFIYDGDGRRVKRIAPNGSETLYVGEHFELQPKIDLINVSNNPADPGEACLTLDTNGKPHLVWTDTISGVTGLFINQPGGTPEHITVASTQVGLADIAVDDNGTIHLVWEDRSNSDWRIYYSSRAQGSLTWSTPIRLSKLNRVGQTPQIAVAPDGTIHVLWSGSSDVAFGGYYVNHVFHRRLQNSQWYPALGSDPTDVSGSPGPSGTARQSWRPDIDIGPDGSVHTVWWWTENHNTGSGTSYIIGEVYYSHWNGTTWDNSPERLSDSNNKSLVPTVAVDDAGTIYTAWHYHSDAAGSSTWGNIQYRIKSQGESWSAIETILDEWARYDPSLVAGGQGNAYLTWNGGGELVYAQWTQAGWATLGTIGSVSFDPGYHLPCRLAYGPGYGAHVALERYAASIDDIYYTQLNRGDSTKRYFTDNHQLALRVNDTLYYPLLDPSGTTLTLVDEQGNPAGYVLYDAFGGVLNSTLSAELEAALAGQGNVADPATGLVHLGGGRWYDPSLGRPLQPNGAGSPPLVPQALNRYAATSMGAPGVAQGVAHDSFLWSLTLASRNQIPGISTGVALAQISVTSVQNYAIKRAVPTAWGLVQITQPPTKGFSGLVTRLTHSRLGQGLTRLPFVGRRIASYYANRNIETTARVLLGDVFDESSRFAAGETIAAGSGSIRLLAREFTYVDDTVRVSITRGLGKGAIRGLTAGASGVFSFGFQYYNDYGNPYLTREQKLRRAGISGVVGFTAAYIGGSIAGPPGFFMVLD